MENYIFPIKIVSEKVDESFDLEKLKNDIQELYMAFERLNSLLELEEKEQLENYLTMKSAEARKNLNLEADR